MTANKNAHNTDKEHHNGNGNHNNHKLTTKRAGTRSASNSDGKNFKRVRNFSFTVDEEFEKWPFCIVWTPLPVITWFIPIIGHTGITNSRGIIYDYSNDYDVSVDNFAFGTPTKFYQYHLERIPNGAQSWDKAIKESVDYYRKTRYNIYYNNCHQYIAGILNKVKYDHRDDWDQYEVFKQITFRSNYTGFLGFARQWWPFTVLLMALIIVCSILF